MSYARFFVRGTPPAPGRARDRAMEAIGLRVFRELDPAEDIDQRAGWCACDAPFDLDLTYDKIFVGAHLNLGLRVDTWRIPRSLFKAAFREAEREVLAQSGERKLSRNRKKALETVLKARLRRRVIPATRAFDVGWSLDEGVVRFFSHATKAQEHLVELFGKTFDLELVADGVYLGAEHAGIDATTLAALPRLRPLELA
ncbi:MAG: hypothetical protein AAGN82_25535 [Myxococcota bacterium]